MDAQNNPTDPVDELVRDTLSRQMPPASERRMRADLAKLHDRVAAGRCGSVPGLILRMPRWARLVPLAAAALIVAAVGAHFLWTPRVTFAEVVQHVLEARTLSSTMTVDAVALTSGEHQTAEGKCLMMEPGRVRFESDGFMFVIDAPKRRTLIATDAAHATIHSAMSGSVGEMFTGPIGLPGRSFLDTLRSLEDRAAETIGEREVDGHRAVGFRVEDATWPGEHEQWTIWADVRTGLPVYIERQEEQWGVQTSIAMSDLVLNPPLDESLFEMPPPTGSASVQVSSEPSPLPETDLVAVLGAYAEATGGEFPADFGPRDWWVYDFEKQVGAATARKLHHDPALSKEAADQIGRNQVSWVPAAVYLATLPADSDWHYAGADARLGDADTPICWWLPAGSLTYRVIYADLTVGDLPAQ